MPRVTVQRLAVDGYGEDETMKYEGQAISNETIPLDGTEVVDCTLTGCTLTYAGGKLPNLVGNRLTDCAVIFCGPAANTIDFMALLHHSGMAVVIGELWDQIRSSPPEPGEE